MKTTDWPPQEISKVARSSGKPLEVEVARAFIVKDWQAELGSYFADGNKTRELDVLVTKQRALSGSGFPCRIRVLVSCKGFPPDVAPLSYSVSKTEVSSIPPRMLSEHRDRTGVGPLPEYATNAAKRLLKESGLSQARSLAAFDLITRKEGKKQGEVFERVSRDKMIFDGLDSALKAALFWPEQDKQSGESFFALYLPVLVTAIPLWDVSIDGGQVGPAELLHRGFQLARYPRYPGMIETMILVWYKEELADLVAALESAFDWFYEGLQSEQR